MVSSGDGCDSLRPRPERRPYCSQRAKGVTRHFTATHSETALPKPDMSMMIGEPGLPGGPETERWSFWVPMETMADHEPVSQREVGVCAILRATEQVMEITQ
jgi:hypothetical protein